MIAILLTLIIFAVVALLGYDLYYFYWYKFCRRFMEGRIVDHAVWKGKLIGKNSKWLRKTPICPKTDNRRLIILDVIRGNFAKQSIQSWQYGALLQSLIGDDPKVFNNFINRHKDLPQRIDTVDYGLLCHALLLSGYDDHRVYDKMLAVIDECTTDDGIILYRKGAKDTAFVDTIGFVCPFLSLYGLKYNRMDLIDMAVKQLDYYYENGFDQHAKLPFHAIRISDNAPKGICDWGRGLAWYLIGLMSTFEYVNQANLDSWELEKRIEDIANRLVDMQLNSGGYSWQLLSYRNTDSSATAVIGWFLIKAYGITGIAKFRRSAFMARDFLMMVTTRFGAVDFCQGDTHGVGVYSQCFEIMPFGNAFSLLLQKQLELYE